MFRSRKKDHTDWLRMTSQKLCVHAPQSSRSLYIRGLTIYYWRRFTVRRLSALDLVRFQTSAAMSLRPLVLWDATQRRLLVGYRRFGTACRYKRYSSWTAWSLKMERIDCTEERSETNCQPKLPDIAEQRLPQNRLKVKLFHYRPEQAHRDPGG
jgi:hypothetical protein